MNAAHLHLMFTHLPIVGLGMAVLINLYALINKSNELKKLTLWIYLMVGIFALFAYFTGDGAEEIIKTYPGISQDVIETHENMALFFFIGLMILAGVSMIGLYIIKTKEILLKKFNLYLLIVAILVSILAFETGSTGGKIRHSEIENSK
jgi:uncharacterized membrane protein